METIINESGVTPRTPQQKERYNYFLPFYGINADEVVENLTGQGENSFSSIQKKLNVILHAPYREKEYHDALYAAFELWNNYTIDEIIQVVSQVRSELGFDPYPNVKASSLKDFMGLFMTKKVMEKEGSRKLLAYKPVFRIKPE